MPRNKQTKGRQKITMKMIENEDDRLITFSKRRSGIYKKASELITLCGAEVGVLVFSPAGKPFSFGHPSMESIAKRFLGNNPPPNDNTHPLVEAHRKMRINQLNQKLNELVTKLEAEKERGNMLKLMMRGKGRDQNWWDSPIDELNVQQLHQMLAMFEEIHSNLWKKVNERLTIHGASSSSSSFPLVSNLPPGFMMMNKPFVASNNADHQNDFASFPHGHSYGCEHRQYF